MQQKSRQPGLASAWSKRICFHPAAIVFFYLCLLLLCFINCPSSAAVAAVSNDPKTPEQMESEVKAAFIFNFMKFIQWPPEKSLTTDSDASKPVQIAILGRNPFKQAFEQILHKDIQGRSIELVEFESYEQFSRAYPNRQAAATSYQQTYQSSLQKCHLLFICESEKDSVGELLAMIEGQSIVTISDVEDFAAHQGMIGFVMEKNKVRFEINLNIANRENIRISSQLLGLAKRVYKKE
jgi:hypothetical protein